MNAATSEPAALLKHLACCTKYLHRHASFLKMNHHLVCDSTFSFALVVDYHD